MSNYLSMPAKERTNFLADEMCGMRATEQMINRKDSRVKATFNGIEWTVTVDVGWLFYEAINRSFLDALKDIGLKIEDDEQMEECPF